LIYLSISSLMALDQVANNTHAHTHKQNRNYLKMHNMSHLSGRKRYFFSYSIS
jgi:hypothetical protein